MKSQLRKATKNCQNRLHLYGVKWAIFLEQFDVSLCQVLGIQNYKTNSLFYHLCYDLRKSCDLEKSNGHQVFISFQGLLWFY
jgi:hypothetical protein